MTDILNQFLGHWEPLWLFLILAGEFVFGLYTSLILTIEYFYDKKVYEQKRKSIKRTKDKVVVTIENGQAVITEKPRNVDVTIENK